MAVGAGERRRVRLAFAAVAAVFVLQVVLIGTGRGEPYPAVMMPGFGRAGGHAEGAVRLARMDAVLRTDAGSLLVSQRAMLEPVPDSHHIMLALSLQPEDVEDPRLCSPGFHDWLRSRAAALAPGRTLEAVEFRWFEDLVRPDAGGHVVSSRPTGSLRIRLGQGAGCAV